MLGISIRGLINLLNRGWHIEVGKTTEQDRRERRAPAITLYYQDHRGAQSSISVREADEGEDTV